ncbi:unnamed protein product [Heterobilharzia americana]|nr:unnamed protein product [Heterobilharzia americana]
MSHKLEDIRLKTNKLTEEAEKTGLLLGESREDRGDEDTQPTTASTVHISDHLREKCKGSSLFHLPTFLGSIVLTTGSTSGDEDIKTRIGKARQAFINLKSVWIYTALHLAQRTRSGFSTPIQ